MIRQTRARLSKMKCPACGCRAKEILPVAAGQQEVMKIATCCACGYVSMYAKTPSLALACLVNNSIPAIPDITKPCRKRNRCEYKNECPRESQDSTSGGYDL